MTFSSQFLLYGTRFFIGWLFGLRAGRNLGISLYLICLWDGVSYCNRRFSAYGHFGLFLLFCRCCSFGCFVYCLICIFLKGQFVPFTLYCTYFPLTKIVVSYQKQKKLMDTLETASLSFLVNGNSVGQLKPTRGLMLGCPLLPYLFIICVEGLSSSYGGLRWRGR